MKDDIAPKLQHVEAHAHSGLINPNTNLGKYKLWSEFNKVSLNFQVFPLFNGMGGGGEKKEPYQCGSLIMIDD